MPSKTDTLRDLKAELATVDAMIRKFTKARSALTEVIQFLGDEQLRELPHIAESTSTESEDSDVEMEIGGDGSPSPDKSPGPLQREDIDAFRKQLVADKQ